MHKVNGKQKKCHVDGQWGKKFNARELENKTEKTFRSEDSNVSIEKQVFRLQIYDQKKTL